MPHDLPLITTVVAALTLAFFLGVVANHLRISPIVGYLLAGVIIGPYTPGFVGDLNLAAELAEIGVILLMFGVGLHFSFRDLLSVKAIAIPGAVVQIAVATAFGVVLALQLGWSLGAGLIFGLALSVASTVVLLRAVEEHHLLNTERGRIAVGWLIVEDLAMVLMLVLLPALAPLFAQEGTMAMSQLVQDVAITIVKVTVFALLMLLVGRKLIPEILHFAANSASRELFRLAVLTIALGIAVGAALLFDVSFALGAFFAGMVLAESELSQQAAEETLPLRDAFAVLFFVSVGMLFDPSILTESPLAVVATVLIIILGKSIAAYGIVRLFGRSHDTALTISASLAQIGEFSFILASLGLGLNLLPPDGRDLIMAGALLSIVFNPLIFGAAVQQRLPSYLSRPATRVPGRFDRESPEPLFPGPGHAVIVGWGKLGQAVGKALTAAGHKFVVIESNPQLVEQVESAAVPVVEDNAVNVDSLRLAGVEMAKWLVVTAPDVFEAGQIIERSRQLNPKVAIISRARSDAEVEHLRQHGADHIMGAEEGLAEQIVSRLAEQVRA
ncbi:MAG TPA: YbaL family putative K(+) efflux transporter [Aestuariivirgaceae bacterium]|jgi:CPA2 family monovalent cation:H+ antiporter-2